MGRQKMEKDRCNDLLFLSYYYKYENFLRAKQVEVANPEDACSWAENSNHLPWKNTLDGGIDNSSDESTDMFRTDDQSFENENHNETTNVADDNPEELLNLLRNHMEDPGNDVGMEGEIPAESLGKRPFDGLENEIDDLGGVGRKIWKLD